jgi:hypothetical protein
VRSSAYGSRFRVQGLESGNVDLMRATLGQRDKRLIAHAWEEDGIESERCEQATFLGLSGGSESTLNRQGTAVGDVSEVGDVGCAADRAARVEDSDGCVAKVEHSFCQDDNKVPVMTIGCKGDRRRRSA